MTTDSLNKQLKRSFFLILFLLGLFVVLVFSRAFDLYQRSGETETRAEATSFVLQKVAGLERLLSDADELTKEATKPDADEFVPVYSENQHKIQEILKDLTVSNRETDEQRSRVEQLKKLFQEKSVVDLEHFQEKTHRSNAPYASHLLRNEIKQLLSEIKTNQSLNLTAFITANKTYSRGRVSFFAFSFLALSILLFIAFLKITQTLRKENAAEALIKNKEARYRSLVENTDVTTLITDDNGIIQFVSKNIHSLAGYSMEELLHQPFLGKVTKEFREFLHKTIFTSNRTNFNTTFNIKIATASGREKWVACRIFPTAGSEQKREWQTILWDIEEEKRKQEEFEAMEAAHKRRLRLIQEIMDNLPFILYIKDAAGKYLMVNKKMEEVFQRPAYEILSSSITDLYKDAPDRLAAYLRTDKQVLEEKTIVTFEEAVEQPDKLRHYWVTKFPLLDDEGSVRTIGVLASDITELKETELKLIQSRKEAERAKEAQEFFLANMSHEIRTPMNGIIGMSNLLMGTPLNEEQKDFTQSIQESARSLLSIINDLLDFSKIKSGKFQLERTSFDVRNSISKALHPLQFRAEEKKLNLQLNIAEDVPETLIGDPLRLQQIVINLTGNSLKFTPHGSVTVTVRSEPVNDKNIMLHVSVKDTGIGIAEEKLDKIFESFTQSKAEDARKYGGTGLGLAIVKQLVELQQGAVTVKSLEGKGSAFTFSIPYTKSDSKVYDTAIEQSAAHLQLLKDIRVLVAEDNLINQKVVKTTLSKQGAIVTIAGNGQEAIQEMKQHGFDLILMDLQMPEMDGYRATRYIRQIIKADIPIIAMTADAIKGEEEKCHEAGMNAYISKPFDPVDLYNSILQLTNPKNNIQVQHRLVPTDEVVDFSFLKELVGNDGIQIYEILDIFLDTMPDGMRELESLINEDADLDKISKQAHFLKSSVGVVKIRDMYPILARIESLAAAGEANLEIKHLFRNALEIFMLALPLIKKEKELHSLSPE